MKVLFIVKRGENYGWGVYSSSGLWNSAQGCVDSLRASGVEAKLVAVTDNNDIDREVASYKPDVVIIEALWVVPEKFKILTQLHPKVKWVVRVHSKFAFLAGEGIAIEWLMNYQNFPNVRISFNDRSTQESFDHLTKKKTLYLPTCYNLPRGGPRHFPNPAKTLEVCNFGAIRPLKNQLTQAVAAIKAADTLGRQLYFHVNSSRVENRGEEVLKNLVALFEFSPPHQLVQHPWYTRQELPLVLATMDLGLQVSLSETFNIMAADMVAAGLPVVVSNQIPWASWLSIADTSSVNDIADKIKLVLGLSWLDLNRNKAGLAKYALGASRQWVKVVKGLVNGQL